MYKYLFPALFFIIFMFIAGISVKKLNQIELDKKTVDPKEDKLIANILGDSEDQLQRLNRVNETR